MSRSRFSLLLALLLALTGAVAVAGPPDKPATLAPGPRAFEPAPAPPAPAAAAKPKLAIEMETKLLANVVYPGDPIPLQIVFRSERPFTADTLGALDLGDFELKDRETTRGEENGKHVVRHSFRLLSFTPGVYELPRVTFSLKQNGAEEERQSDLTKVTVKSLLEEEAQKMAAQAAKDRAAGVQPGQKPKQGATLIDPRTQGQAPMLNVPGPVGAPGAAPTPNGAPGQDQDQGVKLMPRDIKDPLPLVKKDYTLAYVLGGVLALLLAAGLGLWLRRHWRAKEKETVVEEIVDTRPADEIALLALQALEAKGLLAKRDYKQFHLELSEILRAYLGRRYGNPEALTLTAPEVVAWIEALYLREISEKVLDEVLSGCDLVLFAKDEPNDEDCFKRIEQVRLIVTRTAERSHEAVR